MQAGLYFVIALPVAIALVLLIVIITRKPKQRGPKKTRNRPHDVEQAIRRPAKSRPPERAQISRPQKAHIVQPKPVRPHNAVPNLNQMAMRSVDIFNPHTHHSRRDNAMAARMRDATELNMPCAAPINYVPEARRGIRTNTRQPRPPRSLISIPSPVSPLQESWIGGSTLGEDGEVSPVEKRQSYLDRPDYKGAQTQQSGGARRQGAPMYGPGRLPPRAGVKRNANKANGFEDIPL